MSGHFNFLFRGCLFFACDYSLLPLIRGLLYRNLFLDDKKPQKPPPLCSDHSIIQGLTCFLLLLFVGCLFFACDYSLLLLFEVLNKLPPPAATYRCHLPYTYRCLGAHPPHAHIYTVTQQPLTKFSAANINV
jgi:hypothetical protein